MKYAPKPKKQQGFTLIELLISMAVLLVICGAIFGLLDMSQRRSRTEAQILLALQEARLGLDQITRDVNDSGYPAKNQFSTLPTDTSKYSSTPIAWSPSYPGTPCTIGTGGIGGTCTTPGDFDLIAEEDYDGTGVKWIRYQLVGTTLYRGVLPKPTVNTDPAAAVSGTAVMYPYVRNVMNNASAAQIAQFQAVYPTMFPGGVAVPIFQYTCDTGATTLTTQPCPSAGSNNSPANIRDVEITLIVQTAQPDAQTGQVRMVELNGRGHRVNPNK